MGRKAGLLHRRGKLGGASCHSVFGVGNKFFVGPALAEIGNERDVSAYEAGQSAVLLMKVLNKL